MFLPPPISRKQALPPTSRKAGIEGLEYKDAMEQLSTLRNFAAHGSEPPTKHALKLARAGTQLPCGISPESRDYYGVAGDTPVGLASLLHWRPEAFMIRALAPCLGAVF